jgi:hypothetical protein
MTPLIVAHIDNWPIALVGGLKFIGMLRAAAALAKPITMIYLIAVK